jgi:hypothetical protein
MNSAGNRPLGPRAAQMAGELGDAQALLILTEQQHKQLRQRLTETERQLQAAETLRDEALV